MTLRIIEQGEDRLDDPTKVTRTRMIAAGFFICLLGGFAVIAPLSEASLSQGQIVTSGDSIVIQPQGSGVIDKLYVSEGQRVSMGQPVIRLNGVKSAAAAEQAQAKREALRALEARLVAERDKLDRIRWPADLLTRADTGLVESAMKSQQAIFDSHRRVVEADRRIVQQQSNAAGARRASASEQLRLINDELEGIRELYARGYARKSDLRSLERAAAQLQGETAVTSGEVQKSALEAARFESNQMMQTVSQLSEVEEQLAKFDPALPASKYDADRDILLSPVAGRVSGVARVGQGNVLRAGQTIMEVVPDARALIVNTTTKPADIEGVKVGMPATLRFTTLNPHGRTDFEGKVIAISPAPIVSENGENFFKLKSWPLILRICARKG